MQRGCGGSGWAAHGLCVYNGQYACGREGQPCGPLSVAGAGVPGAPQGEFFSGGCWPAWGPSILGLKTTGTGLRFEDAVVQEGGPTLICNVLSCPFQCDSRPLAPSFTNSWTWWSWLDPSLSGHKRWGMLPHSGTVSFHFCVAWRAPFTSLPPVWWTLLHVGQGLQEFHVGAGGGGC